jgi:predicted nucleic acid-binding protein
MSAKRLAKQLTDYQAATHQYFEQQRGLLTSQAMFIDTCAILGYFVQTDSLFRDFIDKEVVGYRLYTSAFVVGETARRLTKPRANDPFRGPSGEQNTELAIHVVQSWLQNKGIAILHISQPIFDQAKITFNQFKFCRGWDIVDAISCEIIRGMGGDRIISGDRGFREAGLMLAPSDAYDRSVEYSWME